MVTLSEWQGHQALGHLLSCLQTRWRAILGITSFFLGSLKRLPGWFGALIYRHNGDFTQNGDFLKTVECRGEFNHYLGNAQMYCATTIWDFPKSCCKERQWLAVGRFFFSFFFKTTLCIYFHKIYIKGCPKQNHPAGDINESPLPPSANILSTLPTRQACPIHNALVWNQI